MIYQKLIESNIYTDLIIYLSVSVPLKSITLISFMISLCAGTKMGKKRGLKGGDYGFSAQIKKNKEVNSVRDQVNQVSPINSLEL